MLVSLSSSRQKLKQEATVQLHQVPHLIPMMILVQQPHFNDLFHMLASLSNAQKVCLWLHYKSNLVVVASDSLYYLVTEAYIHTWIRAYLHACKYLHAYIHFFENYSKMGISRSICNIKFYSNSNCSTAEVNWQCLILAFIAYHHLQRSVAQLGSACSKGSRYQQGSGLECHVWWRFSAANTHLCYDLLHHQPRAVWV